MKITPVQNSSFVRGARSWSAALLAAGLCASVAFAQSSATGGATSSSSTPQGTSGSPGSGSGSGSASGSGSGSSDNASMSSPSRDPSSSASSLKRADRRFLTKAVESSERELAASQLAAQRATSPQVRSFAQQLSSEHQRMEQQLIDLAQRKGVQLENVTATSSASAGMSGASGTTTSRATDTSLSGSSSTNAGVATDHGAPRATGAASTANTPAAAGIATNEATATSGSGASGSMTSTGGSGTWSASSDMASDRHIRSLARKTGQEFDREYVELIVDAHEDSVKLFQRAAKDAQDSEIRSFASSHVAALQAHLDQANSLMKSAAE